MSGTMMEDRYYRTILIPLLILFVCSPVLLVRIPPLVDYPNHLARMHLLSHLDQSPILQQYYKIDWAVLPNLAMDAIVPFLNRFIPVYWGGKIFIFLIFFLFVSGTFALHSVLHNQKSLWPLLSLFFLYNRIFLWGFLNFLFGLGLMLWITAGWIKYSDKSPAFRIGVFIIPSLLLFFSHLFSFGVYGLVIIGVTLFKIRDEGKRFVSPEWGIAMAQFLIPAILFVCFSPTAGAASTHSVEFSTISRKFGALFQSVYAYSQPFSFFLFLSIFGGMVLGILTGRIVIARTICYPLVLLAAFFLLMPQTLLSVKGVDVRIPVPFAFLLVAGTRFKSEPSPYSKKIVVFFCCLLIVRIGLIHYYWHSADTCYRQVDKAISQIESGKKVYAAVVFQGIWKPLPIPVNHYSCLAIIERSAFVPSLFAFPTQQPVKYSKAYQLLATNTLEPISFHEMFENWEFILSNYDYILLFDEDLLKRPIPLETYHTIASGDRFRLLRKR